MKRFVILLALSLVALSAPQSFAAPSADLRVIVVDPIAGGFGSAMTFSTSPFNGDIFTLHDTDILSAAERITTYGGDVFVANDVKVSKIDLDAAGLPFPDVTSSVSDITDEEFPSGLTGITVDSAGNIYVADFDNNIYSIDPSGAPTATPSLVEIDELFSSIRDIEINNGILYVLDIGGDGIVYAIDLSSPTPHPATAVFTGDGTSLSDASSIAVTGSDIYVSGSSFGFGPGIIKITSGVSSQFSTTGSLVFPFGLAIDEVGNDLYVSDDTFIYIFSLSSSLPAAPALVPLDSNLLESPTGLATLFVSGTVAETTLELTKTANTTAALPGQGILYTLTATNQGPDTATSVIIHDFFPSEGDGQIESYVDPDTEQLRYTATVYNSGVPTEAGTCERRGNDAFIVDCSGFGPLEAGDYVVVELEGVVNPGSFGLLTNQAEVENFGENAQAEVTTSVNPAITFSSFTKTASKPSVLAGDDTIQYVIRVENFDTTQDGLDVMITDRLPDGLSSITITAQPSSGTCQITSHPNGTSDIQCGPYDIQDEDFVEIRYTADVDQDAANPIVNNANVNCSNCASIQSDAVTTTVVRQSDLSVTKTADKDFVVAGQDELSYTIETTNDGVSYASNVRITDELPEGVSFVSTDKPTECTYHSTNHTFGCILDLPVGGAFDVVVNTSVNSDATGTLTNNVTITSDSDDTDPANNHSSADVEAEAISDVSLVKSGPLDIVAGQVITYGLNVTNHGPSNATGVQVQDFMPTGLTFVPSTAPGSLTDPSCTESLGTVTCMFGNVGPSAPQTKYIQAKVSLDATILENNAEVFADEDSDSDNNASTLTTQVEPAPQNIMLSGIIRDFKISHPDFEYKISDDDGIVKAILGGDGKPIYNGNPTTITTTGLLNYNQWYNKVNGINQCTTHTITLLPSLTPGFFSYANSTFFPIDNQLFGNEGKPHNYHFTYEVHATFVYESGQTMTLTGDDDIWVFIDNKLALDQGGVLPPRTGTINLDTLGLVEGQTYRFDLFFAERHTVQSNLGIETNVPLVSTVPQQCDAVDAVDDSASTLFQTPVTLTNLLSNDSGISEISSVTQAYNGVVTTDGSSVTYTPNAGFSGFDFFTYTGSSISGLEDTAAVKISVERLYCGLPRSAYDKVIEGDNRDNKLTGTNKNDLIIGNGGNDRLYGKDGNDCLIGGDGHDKIWGGQGNDTIEGNSGNDKLHGQQGDDVISGGDGDDKIWGGQGNDTIDSGNGNNYVYGNQGDDALTSGSGNDKIWGGQGSDTINAGDGSNTIHGNQDNDTITSGTGIDWVHAGNGNDLVYAGAGNDKLYGHQGNDELFGESGNDMIHGGQGDDLLNGGADTDQCFGAQGSNTFEQCESQARMSEESEQGEEREEDEDDDDKGKDKNDKGNGKDNDKGNNGKGNKK